MSITFVLLPHLEKDNLFSPHPHHLPIKTINTEEIILYYSYHGLISCLLCSLNLSISLKIKYTPAAPSLLLEAFAGIGFKTPNVVHPIGA